MSERIMIQFVFPGEGMNIDGTVITPDTELLGDDALDELAGYGELRRQRSPSAELVESDRDAFFRKVEQRAASIGKSWEEVFKIAMRTEEGSP